MRSAPLESRLLPIGRQVSIAGTVAGCVSLAYVSDALDSEQGPATVSSVLDVVGVAEIAQLLNVSRQRVHELMRSDVTFPEPAAELSAGRIWERADVDGWMASRQRQGKDTIVEDVSGVALVSPASFSEMQVVGDEVRAERPVAVELRRLDVVQMRRCIDFLSGAGYVAGGEVEKIADRAYLVSPAGLKITKKQRDQLVQRLE